jgi:prolyl-tRNA editing enzyme YbaK/EbsC (Cys-tRNA(Pro) deacylase)
MTPTSAGPPVRLESFLRAHGVDAEFIAPGMPMPTVPAAAAAIGVPQELILKTVIFANGRGTYVAAIANGPGRIDRALLSAASGIAGLKVAPPDDVFAVTGFPAGGVAPVGLPSELVVVADTAVASLPVAYGGGGHEELLLRISPAEIIRVNQALVAAIVSRPEAR